MFRWELPDTYPEFLQCLMQHCEIFRGLSWFMAPSKLLLRWAFPIKPVMPHQKGSKPSGLWVNVPIPSLEGVLEPSQFWKGGDCTLKSSIPPHRISCILIPFLIWLKTQIMLNKIWIFPVILWCSCPLNPGCCLAHHQQSTSCLCKWPFG